MTSLKNYFEHKKTRIMAVIMVLAVSGSNLGAGMVAYAEELDEDPVATVMEEESVSVEEDLTAALEEEPADAELDAAESVYKYQNNENTYDNNNYIFEYEEKADGTIEITNIYKKDGDLTTGRLEIPGSIKGKSVTSIGINACYHYNRQYITSVKIPSSVTSIGHDAFNTCTRLTSINIPEGVPSLYSVFCGCSSLKSISIPSSVTNLGTGTFEGCTSLTTVNISQGVTNLGTGTFEGCTSLTTVNIPQGVTNLGISTFEGCTGLKSISIPSSVTDMGSSTFEGCTSLTTVNIPSSVTDLGYRTFKDCTSLTTVNIPKNVTDIGTYVFAGCTGLTAINLPKSIYWIGAYAFDRCGVDSRTFDIYYQGTEEQWQECFIVSEGLPDYAVIHYNSSSAVNTKPTVKTVSDVKASVASYNSIKITWKKDAAATGYQVYRSTKKSSGYKKVKTISKNGTTSYTDKSLTSGKTYYYKVRAYKTSGKNTYYGSYSKVVNAKPVPAKPTLSSVKNTGSKKVTVKWKKVSGASGYEVYRSTKKGSGYKKVKTVSSGKTVSFSNKKLSKGKTYYYKVRAYRKVGTKKVYGAYSTVKSCKVKK